MKLPVNWLKTIVNTKLSAEKIAEKLTMTGFEVEEILGGYSFSNVVVGHVLSVDGHPNADKLHVARVDVGSEVLQIVCGANNLSVGQKVPVALIGSKIGDFEIKKASLRGVDSYGMICSEKELGISEDNSGIMVLNSKEVPGTDVSSILGNEKVLDVKVLANRPDCMSVIGLANEVAVACESELKIPSINVTESEAGAVTGFSIKVENKELCPRYMARFVSELKLNETPDWMKTRLLSSGVRPISLFVDISNYVMLEYGQPLHFFDLDKLKDKTIIVRDAKRGELITTLDGVERKLTPDNLVIADSKVPIAIAGVMGGVGTEIDENTKNILIEAAVFDKASIRRTSRSLGLRSEAVARFEKGISKMLPEVAINRAAELLSELGDGRVSKTTLDICAVKFSPVSLEFSVTEMNQFLGVNIPVTEAVSTLEALGFELEDLKEGRYKVTVPFWRTDIVEEVDLYEEVIRVVGYGSVPLTLPYSVPAIPRRNELVTTNDIIRDRLVALGFYEILSYSFVGRKDLETLGLDVSLAPEVKNPLVSDQQYFRPSLVPKMLEAIRENQHNEEVIKFFELGRSFEMQAGSKLPKEINWLCLGTTTDYHDLKGVLENVFARYSLGEDEMVIKPSETAFFKKGTSADIFIQGKKIASLGAIKKSSREKYGIKREVAVALLNIDVLLSLKLPVLKFTQFSKYQKVTRDLSAIFQASVTVFEIKQKLSRISSLLTKIEVIDIYSDKNLGSDKKSVTIRLIIQSNDHTLTDNEVDDLLKIVHNKITEIGGKLRSGS